MRTKIEQLQHLIHRIEDAQGAAIQLKELAESLSDYALMATAEKYAGVLGGMLSRDNGQVGLEPTLKSMTKKAVR